MHTKRDNYSGGCAGLVAGTTSTISIGNALPVAIDGRAYQKAAAANVALALKSGGIAMPALTANQATVIFMHLDTTGALTYSCAGTSLGVADVRSSSSAAGYSPGAFQWPQEDKGYACIGAVKITTNASGAFTIGTTYLGAANTTATYYNVMDDYGVAIPF